MGVNGALSVCRDGEHKKPLPPWTEGGWEVTKPSEDNLRTREIQYVQLNEIEMKDYCRSPSLPQWYQFCKPPKSKWARKFPHLEIFFKSFNCYPTEEPNSSFEEIYLLVRFTVMIIIVTVKKNPLIVSSELTMLHKHDLISPLKGAGIVNSVFLKEDEEVHCSPTPWARPHIKRGRGKGSRPQATCTGVPGFSALV